jgi:hypothetical protein
MKCYSILLIAIFSVFLTGCGPRSLDDFREEGEGVTRSLVKELKSIQVRDDLLKSIPHLQKLFDNLVDIIINGREFKEKHPKSETNELTKKKS